MCCICLVSQGLELDHLVVVEFMILKFLIHSHQSSWDPVHFPLKLFKGKMFREVNPLLFVVVYAILPQSFMLCTHPTPWPLHISTLLPR